MRDTNLIIFINRRSGRVVEGERRMRKEEERRKCSGGGGEGWGRIEGEGDCGRLPSCGRVKYPSDGQFSGRARKREREDRESEER